MSIFNFFKKSELQRIAELEQQLKVYSPIIDIDTELASRQKDLQEITVLREELSSNYNFALETFSRLKKDIGLFESKLDLIEYGIYEPVYDFDKSDDYREEQKRVIEQQKYMIKEGQAAVCSADWTVEGSAAKGAVIISRFKKLMLRAFNGESAAYISKVKWNNVNQMKQRIAKSYEDINKLGEGFKVSLNLSYLQLKEKELALEYEYQAKKQQEKEKMKAIQDELREEEKARREFEQAQKEAEKQELLYTKALEKARKEMGLATGTTYDMLHEQIQNLEIELASAKEKKERALSMAQQTKRGHVYVISNIGSFGENVFKIGMTRRLEPEDRVRELGDASVPFKFDVHAMIYSDEARTLEYELHKAFAEKKVNMLNYRREFFNVSLKEIEDKVKELGFEGEFTSIAEAMEFRETLVILERGNTSDFVEIEQEEEYPKNLF